MNKKSKGRNVPYYGSFGYPMMGYGYHPYGYGFHHHHYPFHGGFGFYHPCHHGYCC